MAAASFFDVVQAATAGKMERLGELLDALPALPYLRWGESSLPCYCRIYGFAPLMEAAYYGRGEAAALLLDRGFRINDLDSSGQSALMHAAIAGQTPVIKLLLARGACAHIRNIDGLSATMGAAANGHLDALSVLFAYEENAAFSLSVCGGGGFNSTCWQRDAKGRGLLHLAAEFGRSGVVAFLLQRGFDDTALDNEGRTPLECARGWGHKESMALLEDAQRAYALRKARRLVDAAAAADAAEGQLQRGDASTKAAPVLAPARRLGRPEAGERAALPRVEFSHPTPGVEEGKEGPQQPQQQQPQKKPSQAGVARAVAAFVVEVLPRDLFVELMAHFHEVRPRASALQRRAV